MAKGLCILLLVIVSAVAVDSLFHRFHRRYHHKRSALLLAKNHILRRKYHGFHINRHLQFLHHGIGYKLRCGKRRFLGLWRRCYGRYHKTGFCLNRFLHKHWIAKLGHKGRYWRRKHYKLRKIFRHRRRYSKWHGRRGHKYYFGLYRKCKGFHLKHKLFHYGGLRYRLLTHRKRFYRSWVKCYHRLRSVPFCFAYLKNKHLFGVYNARGVITYNDYFNKYHGFPLQGNLFRYRDIDYRLSCKRNRFFNLWGRCYQKYGSAALCFQKLNKQHLFIIYNNAGGVITYNDYFNKYHGFSLNGNLFRYRDIDYRLSCKRNRFFSLWGRCYQKYGSAALCFRKLHKKHIFRIYNNVISYNAYLNTYHGFVLRGNIFNYRTNSYKLSCPRNRFFRLWSRCYQTFGNAGRCFRKLHKQHLFRVYNNAISCNAYINTYHGFLLRGNILNYRNNAYKLRCNRRKFYMAWSRCYMKRKNVARCFRRLLKRNLFVFDYELLDDIADNHVNRLNRVANKHVKNIKGISKKHRKSINREANNHVSRINNVANKHIYRFKKLVKKHVHHLNRKKKEHLRSVEHQHKRHVREKEYQFKRHIDTTQAVNKQHQDFLEDTNAEAYSYIDYLNKFHGFKIVNGRFTWHKRGYKLLCNRNRFYNEWSNCYQDLHSRGACVNRLLGMKLFSLLPSVASDEYEPVASASSSGAAEDEEEGLSNDDQDAQDDTQADNNSGADQDQSSSSSNQEERSSNAEDENEDASAKDENDEDEE